MEGLLAEHEGVIIGDKHKGTPTWAFLTANLARLKSAGVKTVYLESLREDSHQAEIDAYLRSGTLSEGMPRFLSEYDRINDVTGRGMTEFLPEARRQGSGSSVSTACPRGGSGGRRAATAGPPR